MITQGTPTNKNTPMKITPKIAPGRQWSADGG
jgi:hypothetical protein